MGQWRQANTGTQRYQRVVTAVPVRVSTVDPESDPTTGDLFFRSSEETTANLSRGGAYLRSWEPLDVGRRVVVTITPPAAGEFQLNARVVWTRRQLRPGPGGELEEAGYAVEFYGISIREVVLLDRLMDGLSNPSRSANTPDLVGSTPQP